MADIWLPSSHGRCVEVERKESPRVHSTGLWWEIVAVVFRALEGRSGVESAGLDKNNNACPGPCIFWGEKGPSGHGWAAVITA